MYGYTTPTAQPFIDILAADERRYFGPRQHDYHVVHWRSWVRAYGDWAGYHAAKARRDAAEQQLAQTEKGRAFLAAVAQDARRIAR